MTKRKLRKYTVYLINLLVLLFLTYQSKACAWTESPETFRIGMFSVVAPRLAAYSPFFYSVELFNNLLVDPEHSDRDRNCREWIESLGGNIRLNDAYVIIYNSSPDLFISSIQNGTLKTDFEKNQFVEALLKPQNKPFLDYLTISKKIETWDFMDADPWGDNMKAETVDPAGKVSYWDKSALMLTSLIQECETNLKLQSNSLVKQRYAFQLLRLYQRHNEFDKCIAIADQYFTNYSTSILGIWAQLHKAIALESKGEKIKANYFFMLAFTQCDEKKLRSMQLFSNDAASIKETLKLAKTKAERANLLSMSILRNPGRTMNTMREIFTLHPGNEMIPLLLMREVNKLEDWIGTPTFTYNLPYLRTAYGESNLHIDSIRNENLKHDRAYLVNFIAMLDSFQNQSSRENKAYFSIALAHLSFLNDSPEKASKYLSQINEKAPACVLVQKYVDEILEASSQMKLDDPKFHEFLAERLMKLESKGSKNKILNRTLYSLTRYFSTLYSKNNDQAMAGLLILKANRYKARIDLFRDDFEDRPDANYFTSICYFDNYAQLIDLDKLVAMIKLPNTKLESYLCKGFTPEKFIELSGTLAFRENKLELAYTYFKQLPSGYWQRFEGFNDCLNEDPFIPKPLTAGMKRKFNYKFNKAEFISKLIHLKKEAETRTGNRGEASLALADALYNCTYYGNAWMMNSYSWSVYPENYDTPLLDIQNFGLPHLSVQFNKIYYQCELAAQYYKLALKTSKNDETKAKATVMLHRCDLNKYLYNEGKKLGYWNPYRRKDNPFAGYKPIFLKELSLYKKTKFYSEITSNCADLRYFLARIK